MAATVLVVEDEKEIRELLRRYLERAGYGVLTTGSGAEAVRLLGEPGIDLALLDLGLPDVDGDEVLRQARERGRVPVVVLTARTTVEDRIHGLRLGADDYVTKPFSPTEVVLRVGAVLQRAGGTTAGATSVSSYGDGRLRVDEARHEVVLDGVAVDLTPTEWGLLTTLASVPGRVYSRYELVNRVRGYEFTGYERTVDSHVKNLRHKLGEVGAGLVVTVLGVGYRLGWARDP
ncbi:response regulator transcription factor [Streptomyces acidiscabies]|uniref:Response regulator transcription factor n=1 Tax=Streptomyces acidiscabies TaxID=42234 RepID=A0AAP6BI88_9ACTN|nr:response regulator transcription factor [Streptomyces acidiscabies]MBP5942239.1 response regulator transcription factor [Streptomyces sp. LBUM 1476]MBZ3913771.1 response regulator transcription factor [Streptomyces acidiscabies]MDX2965246.1 response regulator transcription factor [Streptomyces acidiscabies]MDX3022138.1 response regulator transcription factor [Streptomyces acidiscabies]MDX3795401.1 response regulator transcription factor [Streptomyces acidiscabies]